MTPEQIKQMREEQEALNKAKAQGLDYDKQRLAALNAYFEKQKQSSEQITKDINNLLEYQKRLEGLGNTMEGNLLKRQVARDLLEKQIELQAQLIKSSENITDADLKRLEKLEKQLDVQDEILETQKEMNKNVRQTTSLFQAASKAGTKIGLALRSPALALGELNVGIQKLGGVLTGKFIDGMVGMITSFDEASKAFETQYAMGQQYEDQIGSIYGEQAQLGVSMEEVTKGMGDMITSFTDFTMLLPNQREELAKTATILQESYGIATADFAKGMQSSTKMLGMSVGEAKIYQEELVSTAQALGVAPAQLSAEFAQMGPQLAKFGTEGGQAFKELARISKLTGMEMSKVLAITNKFDTFEGAAEQAGQLNAALGGNFVNAMDLMMATDPAERFNMIRDAIMDTGLTFDNMSYYQKQFYTNALGLSDVGDLALMLSGNMDNLAGAGQKSAKEYEEQAARAKELMTIQETLKSIFLENADAVEGLANGLASVAQFLTKFGNTLFYVVAGYQALNLIISVSRGIYMAYMALKKIGKASDLVEIGQINTKTTAIQAQTAAQLKLNAAKSAGNVGAVGAMASLAAAASTAAMGIALLGLGVGFMFAAKGVAAMAAAMENMTPTQIMAMSAPILALAFGMKILTAALIPLAPASLAAAKPLMLMAIPIIGIGAAIGAVAIGVGYMAIGFAKMFSAIDNDSIIALGGMMASLGLGAPLLILAGFGLGSMAVGFGLLAFALSKIATADLQAVATFAESLANMETGQMRELAETINLVAEAMDKIDVDKTVVFETMMKQTAVAAEQVSTAQRRAPVAPAQAAGAAAASAAPTNQGVIGEIHLKFNSELFEDKVVTLSKNAEGYSIGEYLFGR